MEEAEKREKQESSSKTILNLVQKNRVDNPPSFTDISSLEMGLWESVIGRQ